MNKKQLRSIQKEIESHTLQCPRIFMNVNDYTDIISWAGSNQIYDWKFYE
jgi:hypothetical protein